MSILVGGSAETHPTQEDSCERFLSNDFDELVDQARSLGFCSVQHLPFHELGVRSKL
jgi:hypothetical protein